MRVSLCHCKCYYNLILSKVFIVFLIFCPLSFLFAHDLDIVGTYVQADGLGRISIGIMENLCHDLSIRFISLGGHELDISEKVKKIIRESISIYPNNPGQVSLLTYFPTWNSVNFFELVPNSSIRIAYTMIDSTRIPYDWVNIFNAHFDLVVVPDQYLVQVYKDSGVNIPIFCLPLGMYLDDFFEKKHSKSANKPFTFGSTSTFIDRKNLPLLIKAFQEEFGDNEDVKLYIHSRYGEKEQEAIDSRNIILNQYPMTHRDYVDLMSSFDCYVNLSKGEGFSCGPREALAMGIPCILLDHTAHHTLCKTGFVRAIPAQIEEKALCLNPAYNDQIGVQFNCRIDDVKEALRDVYEHYKYFHRLALKGRKWVKKYSWYNLKAKYLNLVKPKFVILDKNNRISNDCLMTNSKKLYNKYLPLSNFIPKMNAKVELMN